MRRFANFILVLLAIATLAGCSAVPIASEDKDARAKTFTADPGKSTIYVYRNEIFGAAIKFAIELDGKPLGKTVSKSYFAVPVAPGTHTLVSKAENDSVLEIKTEAGKNYFVWQEVKMGLLYGRTKLQQVDEAAGKAAVGQCQLLDAAN